MIGTQFSIVASITNQITERSGWSKGYTSTKDDLTEDEEGVNGGWWDNKCGEGDGWTESKETQDSGNREEYRGQEVVSEYSH